MDFLDFELLLCQLQLHLVDVVSLILHLDLQLTDLLLVLQLVRFQVLNLLFESGDLFLLDLQLTLQLLLSELQVLDAFILLAYLGLEVCDLVDLPLDFSFLLLNLYEAFLDQLFLVFERSRLLDLQILDFMHQLAPLLLGFALRKLDRTGVVVLHHHDLGLPGLLARHHLLNFLLEVLDLLLLLLLDLHSVPALLVV